jgi:hypothetical protein
VTLERIDTQSGDIVLSEPTPAEKVAQAREWSTALMDVVNSRGLYTEQNGNKYLHVEAWELIGAFAGVRAETDSVEAISANDLIVGYQAKVVLVNTADGTRLGGGAIAMCGMDEFVTKGQKTQGAKHNSAMSMAQTRAVSKAFRMNFSYVAVLGGYAPTPAEEMPPEEKANPDSEHYCEKHGVEWFMKGKMKNYAHPIEGESGWCNMPKETLSAAPVPQEMTRTELQAKCGTQDWNRKDLEEALGSTLDEFLNDNGTPFTAWQNICSYKQRPELM